MLEARYKLSCGVLRKGHKRIVVAAGGINSFNHITTNVETLLVTEENDGSLTFDPSWRVGPGLPLALSEAASATTPDQQAIFIIGGKSNTGFSQSVFQMSCSDVLQLLCCWTKLDYELEISSAMGLALTIPHTPMVPREYQIARDCANGCMTYIYTKQFDYGIPVLDVSDHESILVVTTGYDGFYMIGDTETFVFPAAFSSNHDGQLVACRQPLQQDQTQTMHALSGSTGGVLTSRGEDGQAIVIPILCGGDALLGANDKCYQLQGDGRKGSEFFVPTVVGVLRERRAEAASVVIFNGTTLWITGGTFSPHTTEWINVSMLQPTHHVNGTVQPSQLLPGIDLPTGLEFHCLEAVNGDMVILNGGLDSSDVGAPHQALTWTMDINRNDPLLLNSSKMNYGTEWTPRASMKQVRVSHSCGVVKDTGGESSHLIRKYVVAAGGEIGWRQNHELTDAVELLAVDEDVETKELHFSESWEPGPRLKNPLAAASSATNEDQTLLFVAGGVAFYSPYHEPPLIFSFKCAFGFCWWTLYSTLISIPRTHGVAFILPPATTTVTTECKNELLRYFTRSNHEHCRRA